MPKIWVFIFLIISFSVSAQSTGLIEARTLQAEGNLPEALRVIKEAVKTDEFKEDGGAWYTYAEINKALFKSEPAGTVKSTYLSDAILGYQMTQKYPSNNVRINLSADQSIEQIFQELIQNGAQWYQQQDYKSALEAFENAIIIAPKDSTIITYAANAAVQGKLYDKALTNFRMLQDMRPKESIYQSMISIQRDLQKDFPAALITIDEAKKDFPNSAVFDRYKLDIYLLSKDNEKAIDLITEILKTDTENDQLALRKAVLYDEEIKEIKANPEMDSAALQSAIGNSEQAYLKVLSIAPDNLVANFNLSMLYNDQANSYYLAINNMTNDEYKANSEAYEEKALDFIRKALPRMEVASKKDTTDLNILRTLETYYDRLSMGDQKRAIQKKIDQKKGN
ncbi:lipopolysaccharide assembly protein LapB [Roseivirga sp. E12]|uniref:tetratricopeptide repeat protein n=1 Tax=Roseivirga sp. E12 TaxID=2819237 RepID=UPI001ABC1EA1|nr:tetratricopeptide repeat protein [Roseivirga sp. E12]MBO3698038.1 tetratricopeptide repeat protein [Roseivirga sp. E12]